MLRHETVYIHKALLVQAALLHPLFLLYHFTVLEYN